MSLFIGVTATLASLAALAIYFSARRETAAQRIERELRQAKHTVDKIFSSTHVQMDTAARAYFFHGGRPGRRIKRKGAK